MGAAIKKASTAGVEVFNLHIGWRVFMDQGDIDSVVDFVKNCLK